MMLGEILVRFSAETSGLMRGINMAQAGFASLALVAVAAGIAIAGVLGVVAVKAAADFQQGLSRLKTGAGDTTDNLQKMGQAILGVSKATGVMTGPLLQAMYQIISAGQRGAQAEDTLSVAAKGAVAEQANVVDVAKAVSGAMTDYGTKQYNATQFMNGLTRATQLGKLTLEQLSTSMGPLMPLAANLGIKYSDLAGAMSTMTNASIPADRAATSLRFVMQSLENPTTKAKDAMKAMGLDSVAVGNELKVSLPGALEMIYNAAKKAGPEGSVPFNRAVSDMIGGQRSLQAFLALTGGHFKTFVTDTQQVAGAMNASKTAVLGWDTAQQNFNVQMDRGKAAIAALAINVGTALLPVLTQIVQKIIPLVTQFSDWLTKTNAIQNGLTLLGGVLQHISDFLHNVADAFTIVFHPIQQVQQALKPLTDTFDRASGIIKSTTQAVKPLTDTFDRASGIIKSTTQAVNPMNDTFDRATSVIHSTTQAANPLIPIFQGIANVIRFFITVYTSVSAIIQASLPVFHAIWSVLQQIGSFLASTFIPVWQQLVNSFNDIKAALQPIMPQLTQVAQAIGITIVGAVILAIAILAGLISAFASVLIGVAKFVTGVIQFFSGMVEAVSGIVQFFSDLVTGKFSQLGADLDHVMHGIGQMMLGVWNMISGLWSVSIGVIEGFVNGFVQAIIGFFQGLAHTLVGGSIIPDMVNNIVNWFAQLPGRVMGAIQALLGLVVGFFVGLGNQVRSLVTALISAAVVIFAQLPGRALSAVQSLTGLLVGFFSGLASQALSWGANIINNLAAGIRNAIGAVAGAIGDVTSFIASHLPHSPAKLGPLRDLDKSGEEIVKQLSAGMGKAKPTLSASLTQVISSPTTGASSTSGSNEMITLLRSIDKKLDNGRPISRYELTQALGLLLAEGVRR